MKDIRAELEKILDENISYGYEYQMSDYAGSRNEEDEYYQRGREEVKEAIDQILALIEGATPKERQKNFLTVGPPLQYVKDKMNYNEGYNQCIADIKKRLGDE